MQVLVGQGKSAVSFRVEPMIWNASVDPSRYL